MDGEAEITELKDGRTALAYKVENAADVETGAIVAVTTHRNISVMKSKNLKNYSYTKTVYSFPA